MVLQVSFANNHGMSFLAVNKGHGSTSTLGAVRNGIEIHIRALNQVHINPDGKSASVGGGSYNQELIDATWSNGKASGRPLQTSLCYKAYEVDTSTSSLW